MIICQSEQIGRSLGCGIRRRRFQRRCLGKGLAAVHYSYLMALKQFTCFRWIFTTVRTVERKLSVHLIGTYLYESAQRDRVAGRLLGIHLPLRAVEHVHGSFDVCPYKRTRILQTAIHMTLRGEIHDICRSVFLKKTVHKYAVADISMHKPDPAAVDFVNQRLDVSAVSKGVEHDHRCLGPLRHKHFNKIGADKSGTSGDEKCLFHHSSVLSGCILAI